MKYWNKTKEVRLRCWTCVVLYSEEVRVRRRGLMADWLARAQWPRYDQIKLELQRSPSKGKFYMNIMTKEVWFERAKDATWFSLTHSLDAND